MPPSDIIVTMGARVARVLSATGSVVRVVSVEVER
jgi:hypothetical protein